MDVGCSHNEISMRVHQGAENGSIRISSAPLTIRRSPTNPEFRSFEATPISFVISYLASGNGHLQDHSPCSEANLQKLAGNHVWSPGVDRGLSRLTGYTLCKWFLTESWGDHSDNHSAQAVERLQ